MKRKRIAALHLDEVQDSGRHKTSKTMNTFAKRFRNLMQDNEWPVCLILPATLEGREFINHDTTLTRRIRPIEILPMKFATDSVVLRRSIDALLKKADLSHGGLLDENEFIKILIPAGASRFGLTIEIVIEVIGEAMATGKTPDAPIQSAPVRRSARGGTVTDRSPALPR